MTPDYKASLEFLELFRPGGPYSLTAIEPDHKGITTTPFTKLDDVTPWLEKYGVSRNVYFSVNPLIKLVDRKASKDNVAVGDHLWVDVDPGLCPADRDPKEWLVSERLRILRLVSEVLPPGVLMPTGQIDSGGGFQALWRLKEGLQINGLLDRAEEFERFNIQLELLFSADSCHNCDRILRLPGTINRPDAKKRAKGREPALAKLIRWDPSLTYGITDFTAAPPVQRTGRSSVDTNRTRRAVTGNIERIGDVEDLGAELKDWVKRTIVNGFDPEEPDRWEGDRSKALWAVCCSLVRANVEPERIYAVITDPNLGIGESVLDKGSGIERYAWKQIEDAEEFAEAPELRALNSKHAVIENYGDQCMVIEEEEDPLTGRSFISAQSFPEFGKRYQNRKIRWVNEKEEPKSMPLGKWWLDHPRRRQYRRILFAPGRELPEGFYNLWKGFSCDAKPGCCELYLAHVFDNICGGDTECYEYLLSWMARAVQYPQYNGYTAVVMRGREGVGKGVFVKGFGSLFGRHFLHISDSKHLTGNFNAHMADCIIFFVDEALWAGDKKHEGILKATITEETKLIEAKYRNAESQNNYLHLLMASNEDWVVPAGLDSRRFFVLDVRDDRMKDTDYFLKIKRELDSGGREALLHTLLTRDVSTFLYDHPPITDALREQRKLSFSPEAEWWYQRMMSGGPDWEVPVVKDNLLYEYVTVTRATTRGARANATRLGIFLRKAVGTIRQWRERGEVKLTQLDGKETTMKGATMMALPPLEDCRARWDASYGGPYQWPPPLEERGTSEEYC